LNEFLIEAGVSPERRSPILEMYKITKRVYQSVTVDFTYESRGMRLGAFEIMHVPGHCPGHVVIRLHNVLFSGDHMLNKTSPHQTPERLTLSTGLEHYLNSLELLRPWSRDISLTLGRHETPITNLEERINTIRSLHMQRLDKVLGFLSEPLTVSEISKRLFNKVKGYDILLALEETGAHVEYLYQRGLLRIENIADLEKSDGLSSIRYRSVEGRHAI